MRGTGGMAGIFILLAASFLAADVRPGAFAPLPDPVGVARPFAGVSGGRVLIAGGANFPEKPLADGGRKRCHAAVWAADLAAPSPAWVRAGDLPRPWAEGGYATTPKGIVCVAGAVGYDPLVLTNGCFLLSWDASGRRAVTRPLPPFPEVAQYAAAAARGSVAYAVGRRKVAALDLDAEPLAWRPLPDLPEEVFQPACAVQGAADGKVAFFVFAEHGEKGVSGGWHLDLSPVCGTTWRPLADVPPEGPSGDRRFVGSLAAAVGDRQVLFFGGMSRAVARESAAMTTEEYLRHPNEWFRFPKDVLVYDTVADVWCAREGSPEFARAGAAVVTLPDGRILVHGGEVGPGVRTNEGTVMGEVP